MAAVARQEPKAEEDNDEEPDTPGTAGQPDQAEAGPATVCSVCYEDFDDPRTLRCGHSYCFKCILLMATDKVPPGQYRESVDCAICRKPWKVTGKTPERQLAFLKALRKNFQLAQLSEEFQTRVKEEADKKIAVTAAAATQADPPREPTPPPERKRVKCETCDESALKAQLWACITCGKEGMCAECGLSSHSGTGHDVKRARKAQEAGLERLRRLADTQDATARDVTEAWTNEFKNGLPARLRAVGQFHDLIAAKAQLRLDAAAVEVTEHPSWMTFLFTVEEEVSNAPLRMINEWFGRRETTVTGESVGRLDDLLRMGWEASGLAFSVLHELGPAAAATDAFADAAVLLVSQPRLADHLDGDFPAVEWDWEGLESEAAVPALPGRYVVLVWGREERRGRLPPLRILKVTKPARPPPLQIVNDQGPAQIDDATQAGQDH